MNVHSIPPASVTERRLQFLNQTLLLLTDKIPAGEQAAALAWIQSCMEQLRQSGTLSRRDLERLAAAARMASDLLFCLDRQPRLSVRDLRRDVPEEPVTGFARRSYQPDPKASYGFEPGPPRTLTVDPARRWRVSG